MTKLAWGTVGQRFYEIGVDRGVLYVGNAPGVPWNGLVSINEAPVGGELKENYIDGVKYLSFVQSEEFAATIEAYTYPEEFGQCDGKVAVKNGLFATQQARRAFAISYRTKVGNDIDGLDHAYKIHIVYNGLATPSSRTRTTLSDTNEAGLFSWEISTKAPPVIGFKPTAHFVIDSRETPEQLLGKIEDILYGGVDTDARLPSSQELVDLFNNYVYIPPVVNPDPGGGDPGGPPAEVYTMSDGGTPSTFSTNIYDGGSPSTFSTSILDGGAP